MALASHRSSCSLLVAAILVLGHSQSSWSMNRTELPVTIANGRPVIQRRQSSGSNLLNSRRPVASLEPRPQPGPGLPKGDFVSKRVTVALTCQPEETVVNLNFTDPFRGVIQSGDTLSPCKIRGTGSRVYTLNVPHNGCGTKHVVSSGSFFNTLFIRYHPSLEMEGDQLKSIVCRFGTGSVNVG